MTQSAAHLKQVDNYASNNNNNNRKKEKNWADDDDDDERNTKGACDCWKVGSVTKDDHHTTICTCLSAQPKYLNKKRTRKRKVVFFFSSFSFPCAFIHLRYTLNSSSSSSSSLKTRKTMVHWKNKARLQQSLLYSTHLNVLGALFLSLKTDQSLIPFFFPFLNRFLQNLSVK